MKYTTHYFRKNIGTGEFEAFPFEPEHADEMETAFFRGEGDCQGISRIAALELVNKWNRLFSDKYVYHV